MLSEYDFLASQISELEELISEIPPERVIDRISLEARLESIKDSLANAKKKQTYSDIDI